VIVRVDLMGAILVADPDALQRERLSRTLLGRGFHSYESSSLAGVLEMAREIALDLALLDDYFPDGAGLDACVMLRALSSARVIVMTRDPSRQLRREALSAGAYAVVPKPIRSRLLLSTIEAALGRA
jgi:two-component system OmpR family response regulator